MNTTDNTPHSLKSRYETSRLVVRIPESQDAEDLWNNYTRDPEVTRYLVWRPHTEFSHTRGWVDYLLQRLADPDYSPFMIWHKEYGQTIGGLDFRFDGFSASFGYVLAKSFWGQGIMTEAMEPVLADVLALPHIHRVWAAHDVDNPASGRVMQKLGMETEGVARRFSLHPNVSDIPRDCVIWSRVRP